MSADDTNRAPSAATHAVDTRRQGKGAPRKIEPDELCCECTKFGPWGDGEFRYCEDHVPEDLRNADAAFKRRLEQTKCAK